MGAGILGNIRRAIVLLSLGMACLLCPRQLRAADEKPVGNWANVTGNVGGEKWGYAGVTLMAAIPGSDEVVAGISEAGLWQSADGGKTWRKLAAKDAVQIQNRPYQIVFDPKDPKIFWESGNYVGPGVFKTTDGGLTFTPLDNVAHVDAIGVDFTDPARKTLVIGHHEKDRSVEKSIDGGKTWLPVGLTLPEHINFSNDVILIDANTFIANAAGWKQENGQTLPFGIYRTENGGAVWTKVSDAGPSGPPCITADGVIYWQTLWAAGLVKSADKGKTWQSLPGPIKSNPIEIAGGKLVAVVDKQLYVSADAGKTWEKLGPEMPFKATGITFSLKGRAIYAWRSTEAKEDNVIARWEMP